MTSIIGVVGALFRSAIRVAYPGLSQHISHCSTIYYAAPHQYRQNLLISINMSLC